MSPLTKHWLLIVGLSVLTTACGTSPSYQYHLLRAQGPTTMPSQAGPSVGVRPISLPEYLTRLELIYNQSGTGLTVSNTERWAEPLTDGIQRTLVLNLVSELDSQNVRYFPWDPQRVPVYAVRVSVLMLDANRSGATLLAEWHLTRPESQTLVSGQISQFQVPLTDPDATDIASAYSDLVAQLAGTIASAVRTDQQTGG